ncbi:MAG TPA: hypothetical protein ENK96_07680 [Desulfobulbaceae bacterium]|nr:hypothetical protein [Desulfobulbaceae bacterium]
MKKLLLIVASVLLMTANVYAGDCTADAAKYCAGKSGAERMVCLRIQQRTGKMPMGQLSNKTCAEMIHSVVENIKKSCDPEKDRKGVCGDVKKGKGRIITCYYQNMEKITPQCQEAIKSAVGKVDASI